MIADWADCDSGEFVSALFGLPIGSSAAEDFGWTTPMEYVVQALDFNPATVMANGHLEDTRSPPALVDT